MAPAVSTQGNREIDLAEQDDEHHSRRDDAEERGDLQLLQQIGAGEEIRRIDRADQQQRDDAAIGDGDRGIDAAAAADCVVARGRQAELMRTTPGGCGRATGRQRRG